MYIIWVCMHMYKWNEWQNGRKEKREELGIFGYYKVLTLSRKWYSAKKKKKKRPVSRSLFDHHQSSDFAYSHKCNHAINSFKPLLTVY